MKIAEKEYELGKLTARQQFHLVRKLAPILACIVPTNGPVKSEDMIMSIAQKLCDMKQEDVDYVITLCMSVVKRLEGKHWAVVQAPGTDRLMFEDIDGPTLFKIAMDVIEVNLSNFLTSPLLLSSVLAGN